MITFSAFLFSKKDEQIYQILTLCKLLAKREEAGFAINVYSINEYYKEFRTKSVDGEINFIITSFNQILDLDFYPNDLNLNITSYNFKLNN